VIQSTGECYTMRQVKDGCPGTGSAVFFEYVLGACAEDNP
jgi:hypothetical protein